MIHCPNFTEHVPPSYTSQFVPLNFTSYPFLLLLIQKEIEVLKCLPSWKPKDSSN